MSPKQGGKTFNLPDIVELMIMIFLLLPAAGISQIYPKIALVERSARFHPTGSRATLSTFTTSRIGGVLSQGTLSPGVESRSVSGSYLSMQGAYADYFCVVVEETQECLRYDIEYEDLVPLVMWIASEGTSAYTSDLSFDMRAEDFLKQAGFAKARLVQRGFASIEFVGTRFEEILFYIDFCQNCLVDGDVDIAERYNMHLENDEVWRAMRDSSDYLVRDIQSSYINTDLDSTFSAAVVDGGLKVTGVPARYTWSGVQESELRQIINVQLFFEGSNQARAQREKNAKDETRLANTIEVAMNAVRAMEDPHAEFESMLEEISTGLRLQLLLSGMSEFDLSLHEPSLWFYRTAALLRYFRDKDRRRWLAFVNEVQDGYDEDPRPWRLYAEVYTEVYGKSPFSAVN